MWELKVKITLTQTSEMAAEEWGTEVTAARLTVQTDHTGTDDQGEYLPDDEVTADLVSGVVENWKQMTGLHDTDDQLISYYYDPEKAKKK